MLQFYNVIGKDDLDRRIKVLTDWAQKAMEQAKEAEELYENVRYEKLERGG